MDRKGSVKESPSGGCVARMEGHMNDKEKLKKAVEEMMAAASEKEMRLVYIAVQQILKK